MTTALVAACRSKACAPPPAGKGGSSGGKGGGRSKRSVKSLAQQATRKSRAKKAKKRERFTGKPTPPPWLRSQPFSIVAACHSKACAPPPAGSGGSSPSGSGKGGYVPAGGSGGPGSVGVWNDSRGQEVGTIQVGKDGNVKYRVHRTAGTGTAKSVASAGRKMEKASRKALKDAKNQDPDTVERDTVTLRGRYGKIRVDAQHHADVHGYRT